MNQSGIEWIMGEDGSKGLTVNPSIGCSRISPGCGGGYIKGPNGETGGCWAEHLVSTRMSKNPKLPMYADLARPGGGWSGKVKLVPERLAEIVALGRRKKGARVFVCDMSDLFHDEVPFAYIAAVFGAMACAPNHLFYVLTKRPARAVEWSKWIEEQGRILVTMVGETPPPTTSPEGSACIMSYNDQHKSMKAWLPASAYNHAPWPLPNVVFGITCEDTRCGVPRLELARAFPARWRFVSVEPQLADLGDVDFSGFDLLVNGGEAGPGARPFDLAWARKVRDQARAAGARYFLKQAGDYVLDRGVRQLSVGKKGNDLARLPVDLRIRENIPMPGGNT